MRLNLNSFEKFSNPRLGYDTLIDLYVLLSDFLEVDFGFGAFCLAVDQKSTFFSEKHSKKSIFPVMAACNRMEYAFCAYVIDPLMVETPGKNLKKNE